MMALIPHATAINANSYELAERAFLIADAMVYAIQSHDLDGGQK
jgi:hypothetical protein